MALHRVTLAAARALTPSVRELTFEPEGPLPFVPGQWVSLRLPMPGGELLQRAYSIASAPRADGRFDVAVTRVEGGPGSMFLHELAVGATLECTQAQGFFTLEPVLRPVLFVGTGTGVSPLRSMLLGALADPTMDQDARFTLLLGVRTEADLLYGEDFAALAAAHPGRFRFVPTLSRGSEAWAGARGYVQEHLAALLDGVPNSHDVYACGLQKMLKATRAALKEQHGYTRERIHTERYD